MKNTSLLCAFAAFVLSAAALAQDAKNQLDAAFAAIEPKVIEWRRDIHEHPELSNREFRTSEKVAHYMKELGLEV